MNACYPAPPSIRSSFYFFFFVRPCQTNYNLAISCKKVIYIEFMAASIPFIFQMYTFPENHPRLILDIVLHLNKYLWYKLIPKNQTLAM